MIASVEHSELVVAVDGDPAESGYPPVTGAAQDGGASVDAEVGHARGCGLTQFRQGFCGVASLMVREHAGSLGTAARVSRMFRGFLQRGPGGSGAPLGRAGCLAGCRSEAHG